MNNPDTLANILEHKNVEGLRLWAAVGYEAVAEAFCEAADAGWLRGIEVLLREGHHPTHVVAKRGHSCWDLAIDLAVNDGNLAILQLLLKYGVDPNEPDSRGRRALVRAAHSSTEAFYVLLASGSNCNARNANGFTALMTSCMVDSCHGLPETAMGRVASLLVLGADVTAIAEDGATALSLLTGQVVEVDTAKRLRATIETWLARDQA